MTDHGHILVGVDGSDASSRAAVWAAKEADRRGMELVLAAIIDLGTYINATNFTPADSDSAGAGASARDSDIDPVELEVRAELAGVVRRIKERLPHVTTTMLVRSGVPIVELRKLSSDAYLTVVGATGLGAFSSVLMGTTALALVTGGHSPVAVIRGDTESDTVPRSGPVVLGIDGQESSESAIAWAFDEASRRNTSLTAVHAWAGYPLTYAQTYSGIDWRVAAEEHRELLAERLAGWQEKYPDVEVHRVLHSGPGAEALLEHAADAQLLVVGSRGHGDVTGLLFGSVGRVLIHHAVCPVLIVRQRD